MKTEAPHPLIEKAVCPKHMDKLIFTQEGDLSLLVPEGTPNTSQYFLMQVIDELTFNCAQNPGVTQIYVNLAESDGKFTIRITDNSQPLDPAEAEMLVARLNSPNIEDGSYKSTKHNGNGMGILLPRTMLQALGGNLVISVTNGRLVATGTFTRDGLANPKQTTTQFSPEFLGVNI